LIADFAFLRDYKSSTYIFKLHKWFKNSKLFRK
jgi:hypothetical protein